MKRCPHISPRYNRRGMACPECLSQRGAAEANASPAAGDPSGQIAPGAGLAHLEARFAALRRQYPELRFQLVNPDPDMTPGEADQIVAQFMDFARRATGAAAGELPQAVKLRAMAQLEDLRLQEKERRLQAAEATLSRGEAAVAEHWVAIQKREETFAAERLRLDQRTDLTVLGVAAATLLVTWGPPLTTDARFLVTLIVGVVTAWWCGGRHWLGGDADALLASPVGRGGAVLRALAGRVLGAARRRTAVRAARSGR